MPTQERTGEEVAEACRLLRWLVANAGKSGDVAAAETVLHAFEWVTGHPGGEWVTDLLAEVAALRESVIRPNLSSSRVRARIAAGRKVGVA